ncbi:hypothetical protein Patl1_10348 [Pistacia atlantica]|uniref:Uncharacterized protein n=1 Tax=Pistacia atlantica TaxID=434234 RepID=A0ACC1A1M5_9ROSI|nr:hypothetical protein Patl1_10348 [Pistacia atlantica]
MWFLYVPCSFNEKLSDCVLINGTVVCFRLTADGKFLWTEGFQQKEILRFTVDSNKIKIRAIIEKEDGIYRGGRSDGLVRKDFVFCFFHESLEDYCAKTSVNILICSFWLANWFDLEAGGIDSNVNLVTISCLHLVIVPAIKYWRFTAFTT